MNRNEKTGVMRWLWRALAAGVAVVLIAASAVIAAGLLAFNAFLYACDRTVAGAVQCHMLGCTPEGGF